MSKNLSRIVFLFFSVLVLVSCSSPKPVLSEDKTKTITIKETLHDTVFKIEKDSSSFKALLECQNGKVVLKNVTRAEPGRTLKSPRVRLENNKLSVDCELKEQELYAFWKSQQVKEVEIKTVRTTEFTNVLTFWQKVQIWLGRIFLLVLFYYCFKIYSKFHRLI
ncbi:hypothetical protein OIU80_05540 [Flavobacterium sp. LS1R47]|uniref:Lipoprotein n=1 Tax=Flavobacterium frigoritolerans TaxID=2987686 RepID=A0A9X3C692_9FLAO|nr:hypothetical protein [Flavobacterium frigoritolerans]MCV9931739.1 hypothetical protein [Flavobacterium frigoritolerans]